MKAIYLLCTICLLASVITCYNFFASYFHGHSISIGVTENTYQLRLQAKYDRDKAGEMERYIDSCFQPVSIFGAAHKIDKDITINPENKFHIEASKGYLLLIANKDYNSTAALMKFRDITEGVKAIATRP